MVSSFLLVVDIYANDPTISEAQFVEQVAPSLEHLEALKGSFDRSPCTIKYFPPSVETDRYKQDFWCVRAIVMISVGQQRGFHLTNLYKSLVELISFELPYFEIQSEAKEIKYS